MQFSVQKRRAAEAHGAGAAEAQTGDSDARHLAGAHPAEDGGASRRPTGAGRAGSDPPRGAARARRGEGQTGR